MPRDATATRERMVDAATKLFARRGIHSVTTRELNEAAGQRNASALHYHFGSREGLLREILARHQSRIDAARGAVKNFKADFFLKRPDLLGDGGLRNVEPRRRLGEAALLGHRKRVANFAKFHSHSPPVAFDHGIVSRCCQTTLSMHRQ